MRTTLLNTIFCFLIIIIGITFSSSAPFDNDEIAANIDWVDFDTLYPNHQLDVRAAKSRFWKRVPSRKFWKRSTFENQDMISNQIHQEDKH